jgi:uncharacterized protein involved in exopolysaccharide biosynthesis/Mrp family chromosome partitioning ATPase
MNPDEQSDLSGQDPSKPGFNVDDAYYLIFRRKWLLLGSTTLGVIAAIIIWFVRPPRYESKAQLMVRYVADLKVNPDDVQSIRQMDIGADATIISEVQIMRSLDVAIEVADLIGPEKILAVVGGGNDRMAAAAVIRSGIEIDPPRTAVITITFRHPDKSLVAPVLGKLIERYIVKHRQVHKRAGEDEAFLAQQRDEMRTKLERAEEELKKHLIAANGMSPSEAKKAYMTQIENLLHELHKAEADLAEAKAVVGDSSRLAGDTNSALAAVPLQKVETYNLLRRQLAGLKQREQSYLFDTKVAYTLQHPVVIGVQNDIKKVEEQKAAMEKEYPALLSAVPAIAVSSTNTVATDMAEEYARIRKFSARVESYSSLLSNMQAQATSLIALEPAISRLQREIEQDAKDYQYYLNTLNQTRMEDAGGNLSNMSIVQHPTPPGLDTKKVMKLIAVAFAGCVGGGFFLAFLLDFVVDRTIRRGVEVERHLRLPLLISIPDAGWNGHLSLGGKRRHRRSLRRNGANHRDDANSDNAVVRWDSRQSIQIYAGGLRERLITYFEGHGSNHGSPKRVAVTSCGNGAGVTTIATSLASALSQIPNVTVLLVDMNMGQGVARTFRNGEPSAVGASVPADMQESETSPSSADGPLAVVPMYNRKNSNGESAGNSGKGLPSGLAHLAPQFDAEDHDFIVFDLPPATSTSMTPRLAGYMDIVLLVLESEKTGREVAGRAATLMRDSRANVAAVLNKYRKYVPERLCPEF